MEAGFECHGTTFSSLGKMPQMKRYMNDVPSNKMIARLGTVSQTKFW